MGRFHDLIRNCPNLSFVYFVSLVVSRLHCG
jgi:hypothetical protein